MYSLIEAIVEILRWCVEIQMWRNGFSSDSTAGSAEPPRVYADRELMQLSR